MGKENFKKIVVVLLLGLAVLVRIASGYRQYSGDVNNHIAWADEIKNNGFYGFYEREIIGYSVPNYPPVAIYAFRASLYLYDTINGSVIYLNRTIGMFPSGLVWLMEQKNTLALFIKTPAFVGDVLLVVAFFVILKNVHKSKNSVAWAIALALNPALIYASAVWGQIESLVVGLLLCSLYLGIKKNIQASVIIFCMAALTKQTALWMAPLYLLLWLDDLKMFIRGLIIGTFGAALLYVPFYGLNTRFFDSYINTLSGSSEVTTDKAFNVWYFLVGMTNDSYSLGMFSVREWSLMALSFVVIAICAWYLRDRAKRLFTSLWLLAFFVFFLQTRVHERHLFPAVVFSGLIKSRSAYFIYLLLSIYFMVNLYWSLGLAFI